MNGCGKVSASKLRIVGGKPTTKGSHPWFAGLLKISEDQRIPFCGGALINDRYVLTAAHCIYNKNVENIAVTLNYYDFLDFDEKEMVHPVDKIIVHKDYDNHPKQPNADIGLLRLKTPVRISNSKLPICLPDASETKFDSDLTVVGWGRLSRFGDHPDELHEITIQQDDDNCILVHGEDFVKDHICARDKNAHSSQRQTNSCVCGKLFESRARIVGGEATANGSHPWFAALLKVLDDDYSEAFCGGALINDRYVLTAGHCIYNKSLNNITVALNFYNTLDFDAKEMVHPIDKIIVHNDYDDHPKQPKADIGLLRLKTPVEISNAKLPICLPKVNQTKFSRFTAVGWGRLSRLGDKPERLQQVTLYQDDANCDLLYGQ
ncbi:trypsin-7-like protein, partial [Dinothrombium tinctorium]